MAKFYEAKDITFPLVIMVEGNEIFYALKDDKRDPWEPMGHYTPEDIEELYGPAIPYSKSFHKFKEH